MHLCAADRRATRLRIAVSLRNWNLNLILRDGSQFLREFAGCPARRVQLTCHHPPRLALWRFFEFASAVRDHQRVDRLLFCFAVHLQLESVGQNGLQPELTLLPLLFGPELPEFCKRRIVHLG